jgi:hypothetical protein
MSEGERTDKNMVKEAEAAARAMGVGPQFVEAQGPANFDSDSRHGCTFVPSNMA